MKNEKQMTFILKFGSFNVSIRISKDDNQPKSKRPYNKAVITLLAILPPMFIFANNIFKLGFYFFPIK